MGAPKVKFPEPTQQERDLQAEQLGLLRSQKDILSRQLREQNLLLPYLYGGLGLTPQFGPEGEITGFSQDPTMQADQRQQADIAREFANRTQAALRGELPVNPGTMRDLSTQERDLRASLQAQLGPGALASTAGQQALSDFAQRKAAILDAARRGDLSASEQMQLAQSAANLGARQSNLSQVASLSSLLSGTGSQYGGIAGGLQGILQNLYQQRGSQFQANLYNAQRPTTASTLGGIFGNLAGIGAGAFLGGAGGSLGKQFGNWLFA